MPNTFQPREYSKGGGMGGFWTIRDRDGNLKLFNCNWNDSDSWLNNNNGRDDNKWNANNRFFFVRKSFHFSFGLMSEEFCFVSCPSQPPSILPISFIFSERAIYFLLSNDLVSQRTKRKIFEVLIFLIANLTYGVFSSFERNVAIEIASMVSVNKLSIFWPKVYLWFLGRIW